MSPTAGMMLVNTIMPLIAAAVAKGAVKPTGCEDVEELTAEAVALAAKALDSAERRGKQVPPQSVAWYAVEGLKHGRRSGYAGKADVMSAAASLCGRVSLRSMDEAMAVDADDPEVDVTLHDLLAADGEDTDTAAAKHLDWADVEARLDDRRMVVLRETAVGYGPSEIGSRIGVSAPRVVQLRQSCREEIFDAWGTDGLADCAMQPSWKAGLRAATERRAARSARAK